MHSKAYVTLKLLIMETVSIFHDIRQRNVQGLGVAYWTHSGVETTALSKIQILVQHSQQDFFNSAHRNLVLADRKALQEWKVRKKKIRSLKKCARKKCASFSVELAPTGITSKIKFQITYLLIGNKPRHSNFQFS